MRLEMLRNGIKRTVRKIFPPPVRNFLKYVVYANSTARIRHRSPTIEVFAAPKSNHAGAELKTKLEKVNADAPTELCRIMRRYGSDKGLGRHNYTTVYHALFEPWKAKNVRLLELGLGTNNPDLVSSMGESGKPGASLRGWAEFFSSGTVFGADIDRQILFSEDRIKTYYCDQLDHASIEAMWANQALAGDFDIVIEDGLHTFPANIAFLEGSLLKVGKGGYYVVEDIAGAELPRWRELLRRQYATAHPEFSFCLVTLPWVFAGADNNMLVARRSS
jgi:hypothetical protein